MTFFQALILGVIQGATEFFPVSSSAHLRIVKRLLGMSDGEHLLYFDLLCHAGTLLALLIYMRRDIFRVLTSIRQICLFSLSLLPLIPGYFLMKPVRIALSDPSYLGYFLILTGALLFAATKRRAAPVLSANISANSICPSPPSPIKIRDVVFVGVMQTLALIPGISRSGSTVAAARFCGWSWLDAAKFSFLLAVPTILGGEFLETMKLVKGSSEALGAVPMSSYLMGFGASFFVGLFSVRAVFRIYENEKVGPFAWYCFAAGLGAIAIFHG